MCAVDTDCSTFQFTLRSVSSLLVLYWKPGIHRLVAEHLQIPVILGFFLSLDQIINKVEKEPLMGFTFFFFFLLVHF